MCLPRISVNIDNIEMHNIFNMMACRNHFLKCLNKNTENMVTCLTVSFKIDWRLLCSIINAGTLLIICLQITDL